MAERQASTKTEQQGLTLLREEAAKKTSSHSTDLQQPTFTSLALFSSCVTLCCGFSGGGGWGDKHPTLFVLSENISAVSKQQNITVTPRIPSVPLVSRSSPETIISQLVQSKSCSADGLFLTQMCLICK